MDPEPEPNLFLSMIRKGNTSSAVAALGNTAIAIVKGIAAFTTGSGAMFASTMHSVADAVNQSFVFAGSILCAASEPRSAMSDAPRRRPG